MNIEYGTGPTKGRSISPPVASLPLRPRRTRNEADERHAGRVESTGTVVVHAGDVVIHGRIVDLALEEIRMYVDSTVEAPPVGTRVRVDLRVDGLGRWIHLHGHVQRINARAAAHEIIIQLEGVPSSFEDLVQDELLASLECARTPHVLVVALDRRHRELVAASFRAIGFHVIEARSPVETIAVLCESQLHPWAIAIADTDLDAAADELRRFITEAYPGVPLIAIGQDRHAEPSMRLVIDHVPDLALQVHQLCVRRRCVSSRSDRLPPRPGS